MTVLGRNRVMNANEAPEKIWMTDEWVRQFDDKDFMGEDSVEYTRTDVFIEKSEKYLKTQFIKDVSVLAGGVVNINFSTAIKNFIEYMKA